MRKEDRGNVDVVGGCDMDGFAEEGAIYVEDCVEHEIIFYMRVLRSQCAVDESVFRGFEVSEEVFCRAPNLLVCIWI